MIDPYEFAEMRRVLSNLISVGKVVEVQKSRVRVSVNDEFETDYLPVMCNKAGENKSFSELEEGEQVLILAPSDINQGFVIGSLFKKDQEPQGKNTMQFKDGTVIKYDEESKTVVIDGKNLTFKVSGNAAISAKNATVEAKEKAEVKGKNVSVKGESKVEIKGGEIELNKKKGGMVVTTMCNCLITGTPHVSTVTNVKAG